MVIESFLEDLLADSGLVLNKLCYFS